MRHEFVALLGGCIERDWIIDLVIGGVWHLLVASVNGRATSVNKVLDLVVSTGFEDVIETYKIALNVSIRIGYAVTDACLCCQVYND